MSENLESYKKQNLEITDKLASYKNGQQSDQGGFSKNVTKNGYSSDLNDSSLTITAVAVKPVLLHDGFFENVQYEGTVMKITVDIRDGKGLVLVNTEIPTGVDFQTSAKTAAKIAQDYTGINLSDKDIVFSITSDNKDELQAVDGPSAGGAMAVLLTSEIQGKSLNSNILMTGTIEKDGTIGKVGGIAEKADAAGKFGAGTFLVPVGQAITHVQSCQESKNGVFIYRSCTLEEKPLSPLMEKEYGMKVVEVKDISDALSFFN